MRLWLTQQRFGFGAKKFEGEAAVPSDWLGGAVGLVALLGGFFQPLDGLVVMAVLVEVRRDDAPGIRAYGIVHCRAQPCRTRRSG